jgi:hypothetical protein
MKWRKLKDERDPKDARLKDEGRHPVALVLRVSFVIGTIRGARNVTEDVLPYVVCRSEGSQAELALWQLATGQRAVALFLSEETAAAYRATAHPEAEWRVFRPARETLVQLLRMGYQSGILYAVLDPERDRAKRIFVLEQVLAAAEAS